MGNYITKINYVYFHVEKLFELKVVWLMSIEDIMYTLLGIFGWWDIKKFWTTNYYKKNHLSTFDLKLHKAKSTVKLNNRILFFPCSRWSRILVEQFC